MSEPKKKIDPGFLIVGSGLFVGLGCGFFFFPHWIFSFIGCIMLGIGTGLAVAAIMSHREKRTEGGAVFSSMPLGVLEALRVGWQVFDGPWAIRSDHAS